MMLCACCGLDYPVGVVDEGEAPFVRIRKRNTSHVCKALVLPPLALVLLRCNALLPCFLISDRNLEVPLVVCR
jgi:hypothetical protein